MAHCTGCCAEKVAALEEHNVGLLAEVDALICERDDLASQAAKLREVVMEAARRVMRAYQGTIGPSDPAGAEEIAREVAREKVVTL